MICLSVKISLTNKPIEFLIFVRRYIEPGMVLSYFCTLPVQGRDPRYVNSPHPLRIKFMRPASSFVDTQKVNTLLAKPCAGHCYYVNDNMELHPPADFIRLVGGWG